MTFAKNLLRLEHKNGFGIEFSSYQALKCIQNLDQDVKVGSADDWLKARIECQFANKIKNPYSWTFTNDYKGHMIESKDGKRLVVKETDERINVEKLKIEENILFYDDVHLFEDELADNGVASCSVKIVNNYIFDLSAIN